MKHITIGDVCIYSEDEDTWDDLINVKYAYKRTTIINNNKD